MCARLPVTCVCVCVWHARVSVDPALHQDWQGDCPYAVSNLRGIGAKFEDFMQDRAALAEICTEISSAMSPAETPAARDPNRTAGRGSSGRGVSHLILLCVPAHHRVQDPASICAVRNAFGEPPTTVVALPCCPTFNPTKDIGRAPDTVFVDSCVFSHKRKVLVWRWRAGADPALAGVPSNLGAVITTAEIENLLVRREAARSRRDFVQADGIKAELALRGVALIYKELQWKSRDGRTGPLASFRRGAQA